MSVFNDAKSLREAAADLAADIADCGQSKGLSGLQMERTVRDAISMDGMSDEEITDILKTSGLEDRIIKHYLKIGHSTRLAGSARLHE